MNEGILNTRIAGIDFENPVMVASGTFGFGREYSEYMDLNKLGGISIKGISLEPRQGNKPPRIAETPAGILNSVGLQNPGVEYFIKNEIPFLRKYNAKIIANVAGNSIEDYCKMGEILNEEDIDAIELNLSCPNVKEGCAAFGKSRDGITQAVSSFRKVCNKPLIVKLTPNVSDITEMAKAVEDAGGDAVSLINTITGLAIDIYQQKPILANNYGGLSGPAIKPIALRMVNEVYHSVKIPIVGMGGISNWEDAIEFFLAGASAIMIGTANFINPKVSEEIILGIKEYLIKNRYKSINEIVGKLKLNG